MNNKNMTAVEWLVDQLEKWEIYSKISFQCLKEIEEAKEIEKEQIKDAYLRGIENYDPTFKRK
jgi:hypothetical protein